MLSAHTDRPVAAAAPPGRRPGLPGYAELHCRSNFSFLSGASHPGELVQLAFRALWEGKEAPHAYLERLGLAEAHSLKDLVIRRLFAGNL